MAVSEDVLATDAGGADRERFNQWFTEEYQRIRKEEKAAHVPSLAIIATKGTLDMAYPPFILASTAAALGWNASIFFTFYGLQLVRKDLDLNVTPIGNPAMPMKMPFGPEWFQDINWKIPNMVMNNVPGFEGMTKGLFAQTLKNKGVASIAELREISVESGVNLVACQMTVDLFGFSKDEFIPEVTDWCGAATFLPTASEADVTLFI